MPGPVLTPELRALAETALAHQNAGRFAEAAQHYAALLSRAPEVWPACYNLALVYQHLKRLPEAAEMYARAVQLNPQLSEGYNNLGNVLKALKNDGAAIEAYQHALTLNPQLSEAGYNLATMLQARGRLDESIDPLRQAVANNPAHGNAWDALYRALLGLGRQEEAIQAFLEWEGAAALSPELVIAGLALCRPMADRAREATYLALALAWPFSVFTPEQFAPVLGMVQYFDVTREQLLACYRRYDAVVSTVVASGPTISLLSRRAADSRLRIGYVSGDFRQHVVGRMMLDVIARHDRNRFSILLISTCARGQHDAVTAAFRQLADGFADVSELDDLTAAKSIAEADIDVLIDLAGHTNTARPGIYAYRPARSIVTHLGYHGCLGLGAVDYKLTDRVADLADANAYQIEQPYVLETGVFPFVPVARPAVDPALGTGLDLSGKFVFGAFLNLLKLSSHCLTVWRRVLDELPEAILLFSPFEPNEQAAIERITLGAGIDPQRIVILKAGRGDAALRARYHLVHAVMDTFPYAGGDTTLAALDMGVPVVTLAGHRHSERIGASILTHLGVTELVADSDEDFVSIAVRLAHDAEFMAGMREKIAAASAAAVAGANSYTRSLENAFADIASRKAVPSSMNLTAPQFFQAMHDAVRRQAKAGDDVERRAIAAIFAELRNEQPDYPPLLRAQGELAHDLKDRQLASDCLAAFLRQFPEDIDARLMLASFLVDQGAAADALKILDDVSAVTGINVRALQLQVRAHSQLRQWAPARRYSALAVEIAPADTQALFWHGTVLSHTGEIEAALTFLNRTLILAPDHAEAAYNAGVLLAEIGNHVDAEKVFRRALGTAAAPSAHLRLLRSLKAQGRRGDWLIEAKRFAGTYSGTEYSRLLESRMARQRGDLAREAEILLPLAEQAASLDSDIVAVDLIGDLLEILPSHDVSARLLQQLRARLIAAQHAAYPVDPAIDLSESARANEQVKYGYLVDFSLPLVTDLIVGLAAHGDRARHEMTVYAMSPSSTVPRQQLEAMGAHVVSLEAFDEHRAAERIRADRLDVLIDAAAFGLYAKPGLLSYRPASMQIALPGLSNPIGIGNVDYRLSDRTLDFAMDTDAIKPTPWFVEGCVFPVVPRTTESVKVTRTSLSIGSDTPVFGVLASVENISLRGAGLWKSLAERVPDAVFLLNPPDVNDVAPIRKILFAAGIGATRIVAPLASMPSGIDLALSGLVDVVLDTVPGNDYFSVRASIVEGIPIVTMPGRMPGERVGLTILSHLGATSSVAASGRDYIDIAAQLATDPEKRALESSKMKALWQEASSTGGPFSMDAFTRRIESAVSRALEERTHAQVPAEA